MQRAFSFEKLRRHSSLRGRRVELRCHDIIQDIELPWEIEAPGNMMLSPGFSIIHKADNPRGLPHLHFTEVEKVSGSGNALARENTLFC